MSGEVIKPILDLETLQKKANEYAMKGAEEAMKEFYSSWNSPYRKAIEEHLQNKGIGVNFEIPDIVASINEKLSAEVDIIANTAISKTFIPLIKDFLTRESPEINLSDVLKQFIQSTDYEYNDQDQDDYRVELYDSYPDSNVLRGRFFSLEITNGENGYKLSLHVDEKDKKFCTITALPSYEYESRKFSHTDNSNKKMKLSLEGGATLEMPFVTGVLQDSFTRYCARLIMGNTKILMDCDSFEEDMFPSRDNCHCH